MKNTKTMDPKTNIMPEVVEWYKSYGEHKEFLNRTDGVGGCIFARSDMQRLERLVVNAKRSALCRLLEKKAHDKARAISVKKVEEEIKNLPRIDI